MWKRDQQPQAGRRGEGVWIPTPAGAPGWADRERRIFFADPSSPLSLSMLFPALLLSCTLHSSKVLSLEDNLVSHWAEVDRLSSLPRLSRLHLSNNPLVDVTYRCNPLAARGGDGASATSAANADAAEGGAEGSNPAPPVPFPELNSLLLGRCQLAQWSQVRLKAFCLCGMLEYLCLPLSLRILSHRCTSGFVPAFVLASAGGSTGAAALPQGTQDNW